MNKELKEVKVCLGRFQPFTLGHLKMATYKDLKGPDKEQQDKLREQPDLKEIAKQKTIILAVSTPDEKVDTRHPFNDQIMKNEFDLIKKNYKDEIEDILPVKSADICAWGEMLKQKGYQASVWLTGSDEFAMYKGMSIKVPEYEEHNRNNYDCKDAYTKSFYVEEIERTEDKDFVSSISGTKVRQALLDGDKELFAKMMPKGMEKYFDEFKEKVENAPEPIKKSKKKVKEGMLSLKEYIIESLGYYKTLSNFLETFWDEDDWYDEIYGALANNTKQTRLNLIDNGYCLTVCNCVSFLEDEPFYDDVEYYLLDDGGTSYHFFMKYDNLYYDAYNYKGVKKLSDLQFCKIYMKGKSEEYLNKNLILVGKGADFTYEKAQSYIK